MSAPDDEQDEPAGGVDEPIANDETVDDEVDSSGPDGTESADSPARLSSTASTEPVGFVLTDETVSVAQESDPLIPIVLRGDNDNVRVGDFLQIPLEVSESAAERCSEVLCQVVRHGRGGDAILDSRPEVLAAIDPVGDEALRRHRTVAQLSPISTVRTDADGSVVDTSPVSRAPRPATAAYVATKPVLRSGLNLPSDGALVGHLSTNSSTVPHDDPLPYRLPTHQEGAADPAPFKHGLVVGRNGHGKSQFVKNLLRQLVDSHEYRVPDASDDTEYQPCVVIIDPKGEYEQLAEDPVVGDEEQSLLRRLDDKGVPIGGVDDLSVFRPDVSVPSSQTTGGDVSIPFELVDGRAELLITAETNEMTKHAIHQVVTEFFNENVAELKADQYQKEYRAFTTWLDRHAGGDTNRLARYFDIHPKTYDAVTRRVKSSVLRSLFDQGSPPVTDELDELVKPGRVSVVPTDHLQKARGLERAAVQSLMGYLIDTKLNGGPAAVTDRPIVFVVDEAHRYLRDHGTARSRWFISRLRRLAREGRSARAGMLAVTHLPSDIDSEVRSQLNTRVAFSIGSSKARELDIPKRYQERIANFDVGQAVVSPPGRDWREVSGLPISLTKHED